MSAAAAPQPVPADQHWLSFRAGAQLVGLRVDSVRELLCTVGMEIAPPPGRASRSDDSVTGILSWQGGCVALLDVGRLGRLSGEVAHVA